MDGREKILASGLELFPAKGFHGTSLRDIVRLAGVSKGGFYHHFESKEELFAAVVERTLFAGNEQPAAEESPSARSAEKQIEELFFAPLRRARSYYAMVFDGQKGSEIVRKRISEIFHHHIETCSKLLRQGQEQGEVRDSIDCDLWSLQIVSTLEGCFLLHSVSPLENPEESLRRMFDNIWRVIRKVDI